MYIVVFVLCISMVLCRCIRCVSPSIFLLKAIQVAFTFVLVFQLQIKCVTVYTYMQAMALPTRMRPQTGLYKPCRLCPTLPFNHTHSKRPLHATQFNSDQLPRGFNTCSRNKYIETVFINIKNKYQKQ